MKPDFEQLINSIIGEEWGIFHGDKLILGKEVEGKKYRIKGGYIVCKTSLNLKQLSLVRQIMKIYKEAIKLKRDSISLEKIMEVTGKLTSSVGWKETLNEVLKTIRSIIPGKYFAIYLVDRKKKEIHVIVSYGYKKEEREHLYMKYGVGLVGWAIKHKKPLIIEDVRKEPRYYKVKEDTLSEIVVPIIAGERIIGAINIEDDRIGSFKERERRLLEAFASIAGLVIERARLYSSFVEHKLTLKELEVARSIQFYFLPKRAPRLKDYLLYGKTIPAKMVGGDYFNFFRRGKSSMLTVIADVSGKGIPASLLMSFLHSAVLIHSKEKNLVKIVRTLNELLCSQTEANQFITGILGELKRREGIFSYINFGHNYPIGIKNKRAKIIEGSDIVLGVIKDAKFTVREINMNDFDAIYLYTDGAVEQSCGKEQFGIERLERIVEENWEKPSLVMKSLLEEMDKVCGNERDDDITILAILKNAGNR